MAFGQEVLNGLLGSDYLKDYKHASKTFRTAGYALSPRLKFLFHVHFNLNTTEIPGLAANFGARDTAKVSVLVKSIALPNYTFEVEQLNQYNRKRLVQTQIAYDPVSIDFHDDSSDIIRSLWFSYYNYYYKDPSQPYGSQSTPTTNSLNKAPGQKNYNSRDIYNNVRAGNDWGYMGEGEGANPNKPQFFRDITIYGFNQHSFVSYTLINPTITDFAHDTYDYSAGGETMSHRMTVRYETVKYGTGAINGETGAPLPGFASSEYYDKTPSPLSQAGSNNSILGQGGMLDAGLGIFTDLSTGNILGAAKKAGRVYETVKRTPNFGKAAKEEAIGAAKGVIATLPQATKAVFNFPAQPTSGTIGSMNSASQINYQPGGGAAIDRGIVTGNNEDLGVMPNTPRQNYSTIAKTSSSLIDSPRRVDTGTSANRQSTTFPT